MSGDERTAGLEGEARSRLVTWVDPLPYVARGLGQRPLDYLRDMIEGRIPAAPMARLMGIEGVEIEEGRVLLAADPLECHNNPSGGVHGGLTATLLDSAMGLAVYSTLPVGHYFSTLQLNVHFLRALVAGGGRILCEATVVKRGRQVATAEGRVRDLDERLVAHGSCTCMVHRLPSADGAPAG